MPWTPGKRCVVVYVEDGIAQGVFVDGDPLNVEVLLLGPGEEGRGDGAR